MRIRITKGRVIDPAGGLDKATDIYVAQGRIQAIGRAPDGFDVQRDIDARGCVVCPGLVDLSARLREPGSEQKATIASETLAAASGGITTLCCPPDTDPIIDTPAVVELIHQRAEQAGSARVVCLGALTRGLKGEMLAEMAALKQIGCVGVSNALRPLPNTQVLRRALEYASTCGLTVFLHPEDAWLTAPGGVHEGEYSSRLGLPGIPETAETIALSRDLLLIEQTGVRAHFCRLSSARAASMVADAQRRGLPVTADVAMHQLYLTDSDVGYFNSMCNVRPPLRTERDRQGLRKALAKGTLSAICSDHQPHDSDAKSSPFSVTEPGISGLETLLPLGLGLVAEGILELPELVAALSSRPADILGIPAGRIEVGGSADLCIFDPQQAWRFEAENMLSAGQNTPFDGWDLRGRVTHTLTRGRVAFELKAP